MRETVFYKVRRDEEIEGIPPGSVCEVHLIASDDERNRHLIYFPARTRFYPPNFKQDIYYHSLYCLYVIAEKHAKYYKYARGLENAFINEKSGSI